MANTDSDSQAIKWPKSLPAHYLKNSSHRVVPMSGALINVTPQGKFTITPYIDRTPIPQMVPLNVDPETGALTDDFASSQGRKGFIREFEVTLLLDSDTLKSLMEAMSRSLNQLSAVQNERKLKSKKK